MPFGDEADTGDECQQRNKSDNHIGAGIDVKDAPIR